MTSPARVVARPAGRRLRVLVTGAGLVGCHTAAELVAAGHRVTLLDLRPQRDYVAEVAGASVEVVTGGVGDVHGLYELLRSTGAQAVVHSAALVGRKAEANPYLAFVVNAGGTAAVAEACRREGVRRLVHCSSLAVYDWAAAAGLARVPESVPSGPATAYGASKVAAETVVRAYGHRGWLDPVILRLAGTYGRGHFRGGSQLGAAVDAALRRCLAGQPAVLTGALAPCEYLYARDAGRAARLAVEYRGGGVTLCNVGSGAVATPRQLAAALRQVVPGAEVEAGPDDTPVLPLDGTHAAAVLGYEPAYDLVAGLTDLAVRLAPGVAVGS